MGANLLRVSAMGARQLVVQEAAEMIQTLLKKYADSDGGTITYFE